MQKTILITGSTDGIGLEAAKLFAKAGHNVLLHGRSSAKLEAAIETVTGLGDSAVMGFTADLSRAADITRLAKEVSESHPRLDVLINNAGVLKTPHTIAENGLDVRFMVNTIALHLLTERLLPFMAPDGRIVSLSSAAQSPVNLLALAGEERLADMEAYAQSKLAMTMWSASMAEAHPDGPVFVAVNPGSLLASKMVKEGFGIAGNDISIGADILFNAALSMEFADASGKYFDNDKRSFGQPHADASRPDVSAAVVSAIKSIAARLTV